MTSFLLHPIRSFREELRINPLARFAWGIEPNNRARHRRALLTAVFPSTVLLFTTALCIFGVIPNVVIRGGFTMDEVPYENWISVLFLGYLLFYLINASVICLALHIVGRIFWPKPYRQVSRNWMEYCLAGITPEKALRGLLTPYYTGIFCSCALAFSSIFRPS